MPLIQCWSYHWDVKIVIYFGCSVSACCCLVIRYPVDPNHQYWWKTSSVDRFPGYGIDLIDFIWFPAFEGMGVFLGITEILLSQCLQKIPSEDIYNEVNY